MGQLMFETEMDIHARSGRVALVRTKLVPTRPARREDAEPAARSAERAAELRSRVADIFGGRCWRRAIDGRAERRGGRGS